MARRGEGGERLRDRMDAGRHISLALAVSLRVMAAILQVSEWRRDVSANGSDAPTAHDSDTDVVTTLSQLGANNGNRRGTA